MLSIIIINTNEILGKYVAFCQDKTKIFIEAIFIVLDLRNNEFCFGKCFKNKIKFETPDENTKYYKQFQGQKN